MKYRLEDLVDIERLKDILSNLYHATGIPSGIIGVDGRLITTTGWHEICNRFHRSNSVTSSHCVENEASIKKNINEGESYVLSKCKNGMVSVGAPIRINGDHIATLFQGQFFLEPPKIDFFKQQAALAGFDQNLYLETIKKTPVIPEKDLEHTILFLTGFAEFIAEISYSTLQVNNAYEELKSSHEQITTLYNNLLSTEEELRDQCALLTERERALKISKERYQLVADGSNDVIWDYNVQTGEVFYSNGFEEIFGKGLGQLNRKHEFFKMIHPKDLKRVSEKLENTLLEGKEYNDEYRCIRPDGTIVWIQSKACVLRNDVGAALRIAGSFRDITEKVKYRQHIEQMAFQDSLTGIHNRNQCLNILNNYLDYSNPKHDISVMFLDLDNFKNINDIYGHQIGDAVLISVAKRLNNLKIPHMTLSRFGGDEFVILLESTNQYELETFATQMLKVLEQPFSVHKKTFHISASIGIASYPTGGTNTETLLKNADMSMYFAKKKGKNSFVCFEQQMHVDNKRKREIEEALNQAIEKDELFIVYQPKIHMRNECVNGVEALIRWEDSIHGIISPLEFIPVAEERGLIKKIDTWVIQRVIQQMKEWALGNYDYGVVSVNISPNFLMDLILFTI